MHQWIHIGRSNVVGLSVAAIVIATSSAATGQQKSTVVVNPKTLTVAQAVDLSKYDGQLIHLPAVKVDHADTAQVFMFGEPKGRHVHVVMPWPAIDAPHVGDDVDVTGIVRHYSSKDFENDYRWFKEADYPDVRNGDWVIVATSVQTQEGTQLVPGSTMSTIPAGAPATKPPKN